MTTRRDFLKTMTMASAGLAFGAGDVLGARASTTQRKVTDKVKIAYIGIGNRGEQIINDFARTGMVEVVALCDVDMGAAHTQKVMNQYPKAKRFRDFRQMFDKAGNDFDAVAIATPIIHISLSVCWLWHQVNMCMWRNLWHVLSMKENC
jgi:FlaA1/EpsC-like NDP-sugar epimerase